MDLWIPEWIDTRYPFVSHLFPVPHVEARRWLYEQVKSNASFWGREYTPDATELFQEILPDIRRAPGFIWIVVKDHEFILRTPTAIEMRERRERLARGAQV